MGDRNSVMSSFWMVLWSGAMAIGWLLPNHYRPWLAFHSDAWVAIALLLTALAICFRVKTKVAFYRMEVLIVALICLIWAQYFFRLIPFAGEAWVSSIYMVGFAAAMVMGVRWEKTSPNQLGDALFLAVGIAAIFSVGIQLYQWFQLEGLSLWIMEAGEGRPHGNLGQPNQLATSLIWGLLAIGWGAARKFINIWVGVLMAAYLLFGIALTGSRTAWIAIFLLVTAAWFWRSLCPWKKMPVVVTALAGYFILCVLAISYGSTADNVRLNAGLRPIAWKMFLDAASRHPWVGYGWNQTMFAQVEAAADHPYLPGVFSYAHNLFLDLVLWCGIPLGACTALFLLRWIWKQFRKVDSIRGALFFLFIVVIANHAMLENPLYFGYFL
jgi:O-antigen ligase